MAGFNIMQVTLLNVVYSVTLYTDSDITGTEGIKFTGIKGTSKSVIV